MAVRARDLVGTGAAAVALLIASACGGSPDLDSRATGADADAGAGSEDEPAGAEPAGDTTSTTFDGDRLASRGYDTGDCVTWDDPEMTATPALTDVVDCEDEHRMQVTGLVDGPGGSAYPSEAEWQAVLDERCEPAAGRFLGVPRDPFGRVVLRYIRPEPDGWALGDRDVWCGISLATDSGSDVFAGDLRGVDQAFQFEPGTCVAYPPLRLAVTVVDCARPHHIEVVARLDLSDRAEVPPPEDQQRDLHPQCQAAVRAYLGGDPALPWEQAVGQMSPDSWAAGTRTVYCSLSQFDEAGEQRPVEGRAPRPG